MNTARSLLWLALAGSAALHAAPPAAQKKLYCWNEGAQRVCGDALPPEAINRARTEFNSANGLRRGDIPRSLTADEQMAASEARRQAALAADIEAARRRRDLAMVDAYATEADLRRAYGERIVLVEESLKTSRLGVLNLRQSLLSLLRQAAEQELQAQPVRKVLFDNIRSQHGDLVRQQGILEQQQLEHASLGSDLEDALGRYRAMKAATTG